MEIPTVCQVSDTKPRELMTVIPRKYDIKIRDGNYFLQVSFYNDIFMKNTSFVGGVISFNPSCELCEKVVGTPFAINLNTKPPHTPPPHT